MSKEQPQSKLDLDFFETILLYNALADQEYLSSIIGYIDPTFFNDKNIGKIIGRIGEFFTERGTIPTITEIKARLTSEEDKKALAEVKPKLAQLEGPFNKDELITNTEKFLKERFVYKTILNVAERFSDQSFKIEEVLADFEKAYNITLKENLGHWYFEDVDKHIKDLTAVYNPIPTGWDFFDKKTEGGLFPKTLTVFAGQVNVGKSIVLGNIATNMLLADKNVLLVSLEMSEFMYSKRISTQLTQIPHNDLKIFTDELKEQLKHIKKNINSKLVVKEYPPKTVTVRHIDSFITKLKHRGFSPDIVVIDYINLIHPIAKNLNSYESVKEIAEHLRALSFKYNIPIVSATQLNRGSFNTASPGMEGISECIEVNQEITLRDGTKKKIKDVKFGDQIISNDVFKTVTQVHHTKIKPCYKIKLKSGKEIIVSEKHKFPTKRGRISIVEGLQIGDRLNSIVCNKQKTIFAKMKTFLIHIFKGGARRI
jgi:replicative DNA helicase